MINLQMAVMCNSPTEALASLVLTIGVMIVRQLHVFFTLMLELNTSLEVKPNH